MLGWILAVVAFLFFFLKSYLPKANVSKFPGIVPLFTGGPISIDWTDVVAGALVVLLFWGVFTHQISVYDAAKILAGALAGKALGKR